ncbi:hypothetical protein PV326_004545 [Microctonus aethiopoides]|nr:hypothetical protein PV326_004545 [Microctonus aethiopoides]
MANDLLAREKEFRRVNKELDKKTKDLLVEIDAVVNTQTRNVYSPSDIGTFCPRLSTAIDKFYAEPPIEIDFDLSSYLKNQSTGFYDNNLLVSVDNNEIQSPIEQENKTALLDDDNIFPKENNGRNDAIIRFLKAKIKMLITELQTIKDEYKKKLNYSKDLEVENKKLNETKDKLYNQVINLKETIVKLEGINTNHQSELQIRISENNSLKKDIDSLKKEIKILNQQSNNFDIRLNRSLEENVKLKNTIKLNKIEEKDLREQIRKLNDNETKILKKMDKQRNEILQAFKKQLFLIDNLKKQKAYLEASKKIELTREDFMKLLECNDKDNN